MEKSCCVCQRLIFKRFVQADAFDITYGGGYANVAAALCNYGLNGTFVSKVPNNPIGQSAINHLRRYGVDTQFVAPGGERLGVYFLETAASMRASQVVYDRTGTSIADVDASEFDFDNILEGADWFSHHRHYPCAERQGSGIDLGDFKGSKGKRNYYQH